VKFELNYKATPTLSKFHNSDAFYRGVKGPIGSGKSVGMCFELFTNMSLQKPSKNGKRRTRHVVVRNTAPELETTTLKTWLDWFPEEVFGRVNRKPPISHHIELDDIEAEVIFLALDRPEDLSKLLSLETTMLWFNEARYTNRDILNGATGRVGRYPSKKNMPDAVLLAQGEALADYIVETEVAYLSAALRNLFDLAREKLGKSFDKFLAQGPDDVKAAWEYGFEKKMTQLGIAWPTRSGIIADTNPPDDTNWWYKLAEETPDERYRFLNQPSGKAQEEGCETCGSKNPKGWSGHRWPDAVIVGDCSFCGAKQVPVFLGAENVENLPAGYYEKMEHGKPQEWIDVYVHGDYGFIQEGKPVYGDNYVDATHSSADVKYDQRLPLIVGVDFGLTPSAVFAQKDAFGRWRIIDEYLTPDGETWPIQDFARNINKYVTKEYSQSQIEFWGDPSGGFRDQQGITAFDLFKTEKLYIRPAPSNKFEVRREAVLSPLLRSSNGLPGILISRKKAPMIRRGFNGGYHYKRLNVGGEAKYKLEPDKNRFSHPHDALQYALLGGGEHKSMLGRDGRMQKPKVLPGFKLF